jgi:tetratricopeptide (TPR) repeat protein
VETLRAAVAALQGRGDAYWAEQVDIQRVVAEGWVAFARGRPDEGLALLREAAEREGRTDKHPVTPGPLAPEREQLAEMLLLTDRAAEAQREFEAVMRTEPRRFRAVYGAGRAAERADDRDAALQHYAELLDIAARADDASRPELEAARPYLTRQ